MLGPQIVADATHAPRGRGQLGRAGAGVAVDRHRDGVGEAGLVHRLHEEPVAARLTEEVGRPPIRAGGAAAADPLHGHVAGAAAGVAGLVSFDATLLAARLDASRATDAAVGIGRAQRVLRSAAALGVAAHRVLGGEAFVPLHAGDAALRIAAETGRDVGSLAVELGLLRRDLLGRHLLPGEAALFAARARAEIAAALVRSAGRGAGPQAAGTILGLAAPGAVLAGALAFLATAEVAVARLALAHRHPAEALGVAGDPEAARLVDHVRRAGLGERQAEAALLAGVLSGRTGRRHEPVCWAADPDPIGVGRLGGPSAGVVLARATVRAPEHLRRRDHLLVAGVERAEDVVDDRTVPDGLAEVDARRGLAVLRPFALAMLTAGLGWAARRAHREGGAGEEEHEGGGPGRTTEHVSSHHDQRVVRRRS